MKELDSSLQKIARGGGIIFLGLIISKILTYVYRFIVARIGVEEYGLLSLGLAFIGILTSLSLIGLSFGVVRYVSFYRGKEDKQRIKGTIIFSSKITLITSLILAVSLFFFADYISIQVFHTAKLGIILKILAFLIPLDALKKIFLSTIKAFQRVKYEFYIRNITENLLKVLLTILFLSLGYSLIGATVSVVIAFFVSFVLSFYFLQKKIFPFISKKLKKITPLKELLVYSLPLLFGEIMAITMGWIDTFMIAFFKTPSHVGIYNSALPLAQSMYIFPFAIFFLFIPLLSKLLAQNKKELFNPLYKTLTKWTFTLNVMILSFFVIFSNKLIAILFGHKYIEQTTILFNQNIPMVSVVLVILTSGFLLGHLFQGAGDVLMLFKKTKLIFFNRFVIAILNVALNIALIPTYGIIGAATATAVSFSIFGFLFFFEVYFIFKMNPFKLAYIKIILASIISSFIVFNIEKYLLPITNIFWLLIFSLIFLIIFLIATLILRAVEREDLNIIRMIQEQTSFKLKFLRKIIRRFI